MVVTTIVLPALLAMILALAVMTACTIGIPVGFLKRKMQHNGFDLASVSTLAFGVALFIIVWGNAFAWCISLDSPGIVPPIITCGVFLGPLLTGLFLGLALVSGIARRISRLE